MDRRKLVLAAVIAALVAAYFVFDLGRYLDLDFLQSQRDRLRDLFAARPIFVGAVFFATFVAVTGLCLPGAAVLTLVAGALSVPTRSTSPSPSGDGRVVHARDARSIHTQAVTGAPVRSPSGSLAPSPMRSRLGSSSRVNAALTHIPPMMTAARPR